MGPCPAIVDPRVEITQVDEVLHVRIVDDDRVRELDAPSCDAALNSISLVLHLLGPIAQSHDHDDPEHGDAVVVRTTVPAIPVDLAVQGGIRGRTDGSTGAMVGLRVMRATASLGLEATFDRALDVTNATIAPISGSLVGCLHRDGLGVCGVATGGVVRARGHDVLQPAESTLPILAGALRVEWVTPRWSIFAIALRAEAEVAVLHDAFRINDMVVWESEPITGQLGFAVIARLP